jgi:hypothetical protein
MGAITGTKAGSTEFAGDYKKVFLDIVPASASDTVTLTLATHGISEIISVVPQLTAGYDAALAGIFATFSGLVITVVTTAAAGTAATDWTGAAAKLIVIGRSGT